MRKVCGFAVLTLFLAAVASAGSQDSGGRLVPQTLEPFEHLIGKWRSHGFLEANKKESGDFSPISTVRPLPACLAGAHD